MTEQTTLVRFVGTREHAHQCFMAGYDQAKTLIALGKRVKLTVEEAEDEKSIKQRAFLHVAVLPQIAEQVRMPDGTRYVSAIWKEHLKNLFIADKWVIEKRLRVVVDKETVLPKTVVRRVRTKKRKSTEDFGIKGYSDFIDKCIAYATTEWSVSFRFIAEERDEVRWRPMTPKSAPAPNHEKVPA